MRFLSGTYSLNSDYYAEDFRALGEVRPSWEVEGGSGSPEGRRVLEAYQRWMLYFPLRAGPRRDAPSNGEWVMHDEGNGRVWVRWALRLKGRDVGGTMLWALTEADGGKRLVGL